MFKKFFPFILIFSLLALSIIGLVLIKSGNKSPVAVITVDGVEVKRLELKEITEPVDISLGGEYDVKIRAQNREIFFVSSLCPDKICVNTGKLSKKGDVAVCMPAKTIITVQ